MELLPYNASDTEAIKQLVSRSFSDSEGQEEGELIGNLTYDLITGTDTKDIYGFIATENRAIIGSIFFTRLRFHNDVIAFLLSPVAIHTSYQRQGIGQQLISYGISQLKSSGVEIVFTYGDPNYYARVGFQPITEDIAKAPLALSQPEGWLGQSLVSDTLEPIAGKSYCVDALNKPEYW